MVTKEKIWVDGNVLYADELNSYILEPLSEITGSDNTVVTDTNTASISDSGSYITKRTLDIDAGQIQNYIIIRGDLRAHQNNYSSSYNVKPYAYSQITIDGVQKFECYITPENGADGHVVSGTRTWVFKYIPSSDEITNGFTIDLDLKSGKTVAGGSISTNTYASNYNWEVWGA